LVLGHLCIAAPLAAQHEAWEELVAQADSFAVTPAMLTGPSVACGPGVEVRDSVEVSAPGEEFLFKARSARTRGYFTSVDVPEHGSGRFALRRMRCDSTGRPLELLVERSHRYFYLRFSLRPRPTYSALRFRSGGGTWEAFAWDPRRRAFAPRRPGR
jgi:hypothetical protein